MKKYVIGVAVLGVLVVYSIGVRHEQPKIAAPTSLTTNTSPSTSGATVSRASTFARTSGYKDGTYTGGTEDAYYGDVQVQAVIAGGKITGVTFLQYPHTHSTSVYINRQAIPYLQQEAISAQSSHVDIVSGATYTSQAFIQSLGSALSQAT